MRRLMGWNAGCTRTTEESENGNSGLEFRFADEWGGVQREFDRVGDCGEPAERVNALADAAYQPGESGHGDLKPGDAALKPFERRERADGFSGDPGGEERFEL